jgi:hypothetical protein
MEGRDNGGLEELRFGVRSGTERTEEDVEDGAGGCGCSGYCVDVGENSQSTSSVPGVEVDADVGTIPVVESW